MSKISSLSKKSTILLTLAAILLVSAGAYGVIHYRNTQKDNQGLQQQDGINYGPATDEQKTAALDDEQSADDESKDKDSTGSIKSVQPVISSYGQTGSNVKVSARVPGILESSGTCVLTMSKGSTKVTQSKPATPNVSEMSCGFVSIPRSKLSAGSWTAKMSYASPKAQGVSEAKAIEVK